MYSVNLKLKLKNYKKNKSKKHIKLLKKSKKQFVKCFITNQQQF